jgi:DNA-binding CsgD family transcriptional regulator
VGHGEALERGRAWVASRSWREAYEALTLSDAVTPLDGPDLWLLATAAYMTGREDVFVGTLEGGHRWYLDADSPLEAARCALWIGFVLALRGDAAPASGWFGRADRLVEQTSADCVERGWLLLPRVFAHVADRGWQAVAQTAGEAVGTAERFHDRDLFSLAAHEQGHALVRLGRSSEGFALLDEAMVAAVGGELSPVVTGLVYCGVIAYCQQLHDVRRAAEWTSALSRWCDQQPQMVAYTGQCLVHRAEVLQTRGAWPDALDEARRAGERFEEAGRPWLAGQARYREGELQRLRGELADAEASFRDASRLGFLPQPGLTLLRLVQGDHDAAAASIRRCLVEVAPPLDRVPLLFAAVDIHLAANDHAAAGQAHTELEEIAARHPTALLDALAAEAGGAVALAAGDPPAALVSLRRAWQLWQGLAAPYEEARVRVRVGLACRALGDEDAAALELDAARGAFARLGAGIDLAEVDELTAAPVKSAHGLTPRQLEVLRLVAAGQTNRRIAEQLVVSERTVDRHVSDILTRLDLPSRTAATAYAYEHRLL